jgi:ribosomal protein S25
VFAETAKEKQAWMKDMNEVIEELVAIDPNLVKKRSTQIQTTKRITRYFNQLTSKEPI